METQFAILILISFILGSIPFGWLVARLWGLKDLQKAGSQNIGATNVVRTVGWRAGLVTLILDFSKGFLPQYFFVSISLGVASVVGHCFSPFLKFKGGKGVATTFGVVFAVHPYIGLACLIAYLVGLVVTRISAIGSLFAMLTLFGGSFLFIQENKTKLGLLFLIVLVLVRHKSNWVKLLSKLT